MIIKGQTGFKISHKKSIKQNATFFPDYQLFTTCETKDTNIASRCPPPAGIKLPKHLKTYYRKLF